MGKYWAQYKITLQSAIAHRGPIGIYVINNLMSMSTIAFVWLSSSFATSVAGYTRNDLITYAVVGVFMGWTINWSPFYAAKKIIKSGELSTKILLKPISFYTERFINELGWRTVFMFIGLLISFFAYLIFHNNFSLSWNFNIPLLILACIFAIMLHFVFAMTIAVIAFWVTELESINSIKWLGLSILGGSAIPISFIPDNFQTIVSMLPFRYMFSFPMEIILNKTTDSSQLIFGFTIAFIWIIIFHLVYSILWKQGLKKYSSVGN